MAKPERYIPNQVVEHNASEYANIPAVKPPGWKWNDPYAASEGGFRAGDKVVIDNPDDFAHGRQARVVSADTERTCFIAFGDATCRYCVSSLRRA